MYSEYRNAAIETKFKFGIQPDETTIMSNLVVNGTDGGGQNGGGGGQNGGGGGGGGNGGGSK